jgi:uncharacterized protein (TIGR02466 family)
LLEGEPEWWEDGAKESEDGREFDLSITLDATEEAYTLAKTFFEGKYKLLKVDLMAKYTSDRTLKMFEASSRKLGQLLPDLVKWKSSRSQAFPPMTPDNMAGLPPLLPMWNAKKPLPGEIRALFSTPIYIVNLIKEGEITSTFNERLSSIAIAAFEDFAHSPKGSITTEEHLNDVFWEVQKADRRASQTPEVALILQHIHGAVCRYATELGLDAPEEQVGWMNSRPQEQDPNNSWFSVHRGSSRHITHDHEDSPFAAVYYPKVQEGDGRIVFDDPRGAHHTTASKENPESIPPPFPPFSGNRHHITPKRGDLLIFPGWLYHMVERSAADSDEYRVSLSVNIDGYWQQSIA